MVDHFSVGLMVVILPALLGVESIKCSSETKCTCHGYKGKLFANCSNLKLTSAPSFNDDVIGINLANNEISLFPPNLSKDIDYVDVSKNRLQTIDKSSLSNNIALRYLTLSENNLHSI